MTTAQLFLMFHQLNEMCQDAIDERLNNPEEYTQEECDWNKQYWLGAKMGNETLFKMILEKLQEKDLVESES